MTPQDFFVADKAASFGWLHIHTSSTKERDLRAALFYC